MIKYLSKHISRELLDQVYQLYIRPHLDYGDIIYDKFDPNMHLEFTKIGASLVKLWQSLVCGGVQADRDFMRNWDGKPCITDDGTNGCVTFFSK